MNRIYGNGLRRLTSDRIIIIIFHRKQVLWKGLYIKMEWYGLLQTHLGLLCIYQNPVI